MAEYRFIDNTPESGVLRYADNLSIPNDIANIDWVNFQEYLSAGGDVDPYYDKQIAMDMRFIELDELVVDKEKEPFYYAPKDANFYLDHDLATKAKVRSKDTDTIWLSSDKDETGVKRKKVDFTKQELSDFADYVIDFGESLLGVKFFHQEAIQDLFLDELKTYQDILDYDFTVGWP